MYKFMVIDPKDMCNVESIRLLNYFDGLCENPFDLAFYFFQLFSEYVLFPSFFLTIDF
jgi:hypothetical protein